MTPAALVRTCGGVSQAARELGVTRPTIYNWLKAWKIPVRMLPYVRERLK